MVETRSGITSVRARRVVKICACDREVQSEGFYGRAGFVQ